MFICRTAAKCSRASLATIPPKLVCVMGNFYYINHALCHVELCAITYESIYAQSTVSNFIANTVTMVHII